MQPYEVCFKYPELSKISRYSGKRQDIFHYGVLNGFQLRDLALHTLSSPNMLGHLPSSITSRKYYLIITVLLFISLLLFWSRPSVSLVAISFRDQVFDYPDGYQVSFSAEMLSSLAGSLTKLSFRGQNPLDDLTHISLLTNLTRLSCDSRSFEKVSLTALTNLLVLITHTQTVSPESISTLTKLQFLQLYRKWRPNQFHRFRCLTCL